MVSFASCAKWSVSRSRITQSSTPSWLLSCRVGSEVKVVDMMVCTGFGAVLLLPQATKVLSPRQRGNRTTDRKRDGTSIAPPWVARTE